MQSLTRASSAKDLSMNDASRKDYWENVYAVKGETDVSWFQENPETSLQLIAKLPISLSDGIIDIGGGASRLVDNLIERTFTNLAVLDLSAAALDVARKRLGARAAEIDWIVADITRWKPERRYCLWHDRAAYHFLIEAADRQSYMDCLREAVEPGGFAIIGTFAPDGPERCSGLRIMRYDANIVSHDLGQDFVLIDHQRHDHMTPAGVVQKFQFSVFRREPPIDEVGLE